MNVLKAIIFLIALSVLVAGFTLPLWWNEAEPFITSLPDYTGGKFNKLLAAGGAFDTEVSSDIDISHDPIQTPYTGYPIIKKYENTEFIIKPVAEYELSGMVVGMRLYSPADFSSTKSNYYFATLSPIDLCVIWGKDDEPHMNGDLPYIQLTYKLIDRKCSSSYKSEQVFFPKFLNSHLSNNHIISANDNISNEIKTIKNKEKVLLKGFLVDVDGTIIFSENEKVKIPWKTSLLRTDEGDGACEIFYVTNVTIGNRVHE